MNRVVSIEKLVGYGENGVDLAMSWIRNKEDPHRELVDVECTERTTVPGSPYRNGKGSRLLW